ncbi:ABC transporter permease [Candidatus Uabimicrobium sp. HlEnr_7]|uniref:ABC transporter permease n=1 Tax=Candidatus Uabimicrobium helgolandensis TaxID=3095367 RepID=UPI003557735C
MTNTQENIKRETLWSKAFRKFFRDKMGVLSFSIVCLYGIIALGVALGLWATEWSELNPTHKEEGPSVEFLFGTNALGQDVYQRTIFSTKTAFEVGLVVALAATILGAVVGCISGYFSGTWIDEFFLWIIGCIDCIPFYLFVAAVGFAVNTFAVYLNASWGIKGFEYFAMHIAMIATFWTATARLVRGEVIKLKHLEFVEAAHAIGVPGSKIIFKHILPNTFHILLVQATIAFVSAIKSEVILSYLGLGVKNTVSWGKMIAESTQQVPAGVYNNFFAASVFLFVLVMAFNIFADALQDALDPKKVS